MLTAKRHFAFSLSWHFEVCVNLRTRLIRLTEIISLYKMV